VQNFPYTVHVGYDLIRLMDNLKSLDYQETTVQWEEWGLSDDDASESEYVEGEVD